MTTSTITSNRSEPRYRVRVAIEGKDRRVPLQVFGAIRTIRPLEIKDMLLTPLNDLRHDGEVVFELSARQRQAALAWWNSLCWEDLRENIDFPDSELFAQVFVAIKCARLVQNRRSRANRLRSASIRAA